MPETVRRRAGGARRLRWLPAALLIALPLAASAQEIPSSPLLPRDHWAVEAARRLDDLGLAPGYLPPQMLVPRHLVAHAFAEAVERSDGVAADLAALILAWRTRFVEEFPEFERATGAGPSDSAHPAPALRYGGTVGGGAAVERGVASPGLYEFEPARTGATPVPDAAGAFLAADLEVAHGTALAAQAAGSLGLDGFELDRGEAIVGWRALRLSVGREAVGYGPGTGGGVVLGGEHPLDRVELSTAEPVGLGVFGPAAFQLFAGRLPEPRHPGHPWLAGAAATLRPVDRVTLSIQRALMMAGDSAGGPLQPGDFVPAFFGQNVEEVDQVLSVAGRVRLPTESVLPLTVYCEWGAEDSAGAPFDAPGLICGGDVPALPFAPGLALGLEHAQLGARPVNGPPWYRHSRFPGGWALDEGPLGHPLGGEGRQWLAHAALSTLEGLLDLDVRGFRRMRTGENLYLPGRAGRSHGGSVSVFWHVLPVIDLAGRVHHERGDGWSETRAETTIGYIF